MEEKDVFKYIKQKVEEEQLPFDNDDWNDLQSRLDRDGEKKVIAFFPIYAKKAMVAGIAAAAAVIIGVFLLTRQSDDLPVTPSVTSSPATTPPHSNVPTPPTATREPEVPLTAPPVYISKKQRAPKKTSTQVLQYDPWKELVKYTEPDPQPQEQPLVKTDPIDTAFKTIAPVRNKEVKKLDYSEFAQKDKMEERKLLFIAGGGVIAADQGLGYSLNAAIAKKITGNLAVQAGVAYINNNRKTDFTQTTITARPNVGLSGQGIEYDTATSNFTNKIPQSYAQAEVAMNLQILKRSNLIVGVDAQRLLKEKEEVYSLNSLSTDTKDVALWSSGVKLRYQYMFVRNLSLGLSYRFDVSSALTKKLQNNFTQAFISYQFGK